MHLCATLHQWPLIIRILSKPKSGRKAYVCRAEAEENRCSSFQTRIRINCGALLFKFSNPPKSFLNAASRTPEKNCLKVKVDT